MLSTDDLGAFFAPHHTTLAGELASLAASFGQIEDDGALALRMGRECDLYRFFVDEHVDLRAICLVREMLGYQNPVADSIFAVHGLGTYPVRLTGSGSQKERYLGPCRAGDKIAGFALTSPKQVAMLLPCRPERSVMATHMFCPAKRLSYPTSEWPAISSSSPMPTRRPVAKALPLSWSTVILRGFRRSPLCWARRIRSAG